MNVRKRFACRKVTFCVMAVVLAMSGTLTGPGYVAYAQGNPPQIHVRERPMPKIRIVRDASGALQGSGQASGAATQQTLRQTAGRQALSIQQTTRPTPRFMITAPMAAAVAVGTIIVVGGAYLYIDPREGFDVAEEFEIQEAELQAELDLLRSDMMGSFRIFEQRYGTVPFVAVQAYVSAMNEGRNPQEAFQAAEDAWLTDYLKHYASAFTNAELWFRTIATAILYDPKTNTYYPVFAVSRNNFGEQHEEWWGEQIFTMIEGDPINAGRRMPDEQRHRLGDAENIIIEYAGSTELEVVSIVASRRACGHCSWAISTLNPKPRFSFVEDLPTLPEKLKPAGN